MAKKVPGKALLFIPDISGFTSFIHNTEIKHSQHIISELLELLIDSNDLNLELVEIEGDALFYFKQGRLPTYSELIQQVKKMFVQFHHHLKLYEHRRICQCGACTSAHQDLKLKFVTHFGEIDFINVKGNIKPLGSSVIAVHRLLKNSIPLDAYALISQDLSKEFSDIPEQSSRREGQESYSEIGQIDYHYLTIDQWMVDIPDVPPLVVDDSKKLSPIEGQIFIEKNVLDVYEVLTNLKHRKGWSDGLEDFVFDENEMNQDGTEHTCVIAGNKIHFISRKDRSTDDDWVYIEQTSSIPFTKKVSNYFVLTSENEGTRVNVKNYVEPKNFFSRIMIPLIKRNISKSVKTVLKDLKKYAENYG